MTYEVSSALGSSLLKQPARAFVPSLVSPVALAKRLPESTHENPDPVPQSVDVATDNLSAETLAKGSRVAVRGRLRSGSLRADSHRLVIGFLVLGAALGAVGCRQFPETGVSSDLESQGRKIFRDDTFGNEPFWTDTARLHEVVQKEIQPLEALSLGLKVDMDRLNLVSFLFSNPFGTSGTRNLLKRDAVVGVKATFDKKGRIERIGITCALCHSTVDNALLPGIGHRLDGWPNRDLEVGKILA
jgi:hypothetical protein